MATVASKKDSVKRSPRCNKTCWSVRSHPSIFTPKSISWWDETLLYGMNKRIRWEERSSCEGVSKWVCRFVSEGQRSQRRCIKGKEDGECIHVQSDPSWSTCGWCGGRGIYAICSLLHSPGDFCLSPPRTWSPQGHGPCLVKTIRTRRGLSLKVIKKRTCWLGEKPAIGFLGATFFSCADCIQRSV